MFRAAWWASNTLLAVALLGLMYSGVREYSVRRYLDGFSDAIVPNFLPAEQKVEAILDWMRAETSRGVATNPDELGRRDPQMTLNYQQLLNVCGTATNAFLNLARSSDLQVRRLLLLTPDRKTKHVVAEVLINERWVIIDPAYRVMMRDAKGRYLTRKDLRDPAIFAEATDAVPNYGKEYTYDHYAHVRMARLPLDGLQLRRMLDWINPEWDEAVDWSLLLERESFFYLVLSATATIFFLVARGMLAYYADRRLRIPRFQLREHMIHASTTFVSTPEIKQ
jgi:hypothetical protein